MSEKKSNNNSTGLVLAVSVLCFLIVVIVFLINQDTIISNLKTTRFCERVFGTTPEFILNYEVNTDKSKNEERSKEKTENEVEIAKDTELLIEENEPVMIEVTVPRTPEVSVIEEELKKQEEASVEKKTPVEVKEVQKPKEKPVQNQVQPPVKKAQTEAKLYFVVIDKDGSISKKEIKRTIDKNDSPLTTNIKLLLAGPQAGEKAESLIPPGTKLLSAKVSSDGIAYLNFNDAFEFNPKGVEGSLNQLMQIVFTATEFSTVKTVQFLIDGQKKEYLGSEGVWIGTPLSRASF